MTGDEAKRKLRDEGVTLKQFAELNGFPYYMVSRVVSGSCKANFGRAHDVAVALGMKKKSGSKSTRSA